MAAATALVPVCLAVGSSIVAGQPAGSSVPDAVKPGSKAALSWGGIAGGIVGLAAGVSLGRAVDRARGFDDGCDSCTRWGAATGAGAGAIAGISVGVHLANSRRGRFAKVVIRTAGAIAAGWTLSYIGYRAGGEGYDLPGVLGGAGVAVYLAVRTERATTGPRLAVDGVVGLAIPRERRVLVYSR